MIPRQLWYQPHTLFALQSHARLEVVHLHLQPLQRQVALARLALVGDEDHHDDEDEQGPGRRNADDRRAAERAVGRDVDHTRGELDTTHARLVMLKDDRGRLSQVSAQ